MLDSACSSNFEVQPRLQSQPVQSAHDLSCSVDCSHMLGCATSVGSAKAGSDPILVQDGKHHRLDGAAAESLIFRGTGCSGSSGKGSPETQQAPGSPDPEPAAGCPSPGLWHPAAAAAWRPSAGRRQTAMSCRLHTVPVSSECCFLVILPKLVWRPSAGRQQACMSRLQSVQLIFRVVDSKCCDHNRFGHRLNDALKPPMCLIKLAP